MMQTRRNGGSTRWLAALLLAGHAGLLAIGSAYAQDISYSSQTEYPDQDRAAVSRELAQTRAVAGDDLEAAFNWRCLISPLDREHVIGAQHDGLVPAVQIFDNLYSVGQNAVSAFVIETSEGLILIDALNNEAEAREIIVPNLIALGLDPARLRYVIVTHGHGDHWGGAKYLQDTFGTRIIMSRTDWDLVESPTRGGGPFASLTPPTRDLEAADGDVVRLGDTEVQLYVTPGHTMGTLSLIFPVRLNGKQHRAGLMGGTGGGTTAAAARQQIASLSRWGELTRAAGVDVLVTNHPAHMNANEKQALLRYNAQGEQHPYVYGVERYQRYMQVMAGCSRVQLARLGEPSED